MSPCWALWKSLQRKIEEMQGLFILHIHTEHTAANHKNNSSWYLSVNILLARQSKLSPWLWKQLPSLCWKQHTTINCCKTFCIGKAFTGSECCWKLAFSKVFDLCNIVQCGAGFSVRLHGDKGFIVCVQSAFFLRIHAWLILHALGHCTHPGRDWIGALVLGGVQGC